MRFIFMNKNMDTQHIRNARGIYLLMFVCVSAAALAAPATLTQSVTYNGSETITLRLTKENLRGDHFELWVQNSSGGYDVVTPVEERSYIGTVDEYPDAVSCGILKDDGTFWGAVYFDRGVTWFTLGSSLIRTRATDYGPDDFHSFNWTDWSIVGPGDAGTTMYGFHAGIDVCNDYYNHAGSTAAAFEQIEHSVSMVRPIYMSNALMRLYLGRVILRGDWQQDPYYGTTNFALDVAQHWQANHADAPRHVWAGVSPTKIGGGLAWGCVVGTISAASGNQSYYGEGDFEAVWRHEMGHNWCGSDYHAGNPEGATIMCGNAAARFSGSMVDYMFGHRDSRIGIFDNLGTYSTVDIPPYAALDQVTVQIDLGAATIDVMANDYDANGDSLSIVSFDALSQGGAVITRSSGTGPGGRDELIYTPSGYTGLDSFYYKLEDSSGSTASGAVVIRAWSPGLVYHWPLDGHLYDMFSGNYGLGYGKVFFAEGADGISNAAISVTSSDFVRSAGYISIYGQPRTINCWFKIDTAQDQSIFSYGNRGSALNLCEINITSDRKIFGHFWGAGNDTLAGTSQIFPLNEWVMATLVYDGTTVYMYQNGNLINSKAIPLYTTETAAYIGGGNGSWGQWDYDQFDGQIDDVRVYSYALDPTEIAALYNDISSGKRLVNHWPLDGDLVDVVGGNDGYNYGTINLEDGADGTTNGAISVTGSDFVWSAETLSFAGPAQRTISFWFKSAQQMQAPVSFGGRSSEGTLFEVLLDFPTGGYCGHFWGPGWDTDAGGTGTHPSVSWNNWTMVTMTYDGSDVKLYQNDTLKRTATFSLYTARSHLYIGGGNGSGGTWDYDQFDGQIDDVRLYNYALDASEVASLYSDMLDTTYVCENRPTMDFTNDCVVDLADLVMFVETWLDCGRWPESACP